MEKVNSPELEFYVPSSLDEILGNDDAITVIKDYAKDIEAGKKRKPLMLHGRPGTGKTLSAYLIAKRMSWHVVEMNSGDYRDRDSIMKVAASAAGSRYLFGGRNMILFDEIDELMPRYDTGAASAINEIVERSTSPIIFVADDPWNQSVRFLRGKVELVGFKRISNDYVAKIISTFLEKTRLRMDKKMVELIAARSRGDARSAINDAWTMAGSDEEDLSAIGMRNSKEEIFGVLDKVFQSYTVAAPLMAVTNSDEEGDMLIKWIDENLTNRYTDNEEISEALNSLSLATTYYNRASRSQYYTYWRYMNVMMSSGVALSKVHSPSMLKRYSFPKVIKSLSESKGERGIEARISEKIARRVHAGRRRVAMNEMRLIAREVRAAIESGTTKDKVAEELEREFQIDGKETEYLLSLK